MNLNMIKPKNETEDLLLSITKNCETLIQQIHRKAVYTLVFKLTKSRETLQFRPPISIDESWLLGLTSLELYNSVFNIPEENNKFNFYKIPESKSGAVSFKKVRDENERDLNISKITAANLQDDVIGLFIIEE